MSNKLEDARRIINDVDAQMADLFVTRMRAVEQVYAYKQEHNLPILDPDRENAVVERNKALVADAALQGYYVDFLKNTMAVSRVYQSHLQDGDSVCATTLPMHLGADSYDIVVERGVLANAGQHLNLDRRVLVVTDSGVPAAYPQTVAYQCKEAVICTIPEGEASKNMESFSTLLQTMLDHGFSRRDCVVAVGGGVVGDLAGFAASAYMRGVDFYNIPTTLLSQIDSSIGGKTAINFGGVKNTVGAFYQPQKVLIDPALLKTLPARQVANGLAEAVKMALTCDEELFSLIENEDIEAHMDEIILRSLSIKKTVVERDEKEAGLRKILNFGHTIGHGIESNSDLYHGECVALGMLPMCGESIRPRVLAVLKKCGLYRGMEYDWDAIAAAIVHDKKADGDTVTAITVEAVGRYTINTLSCSEIIDRAKNCLEGLKE